VNRLNRENQSLKRSRMLHPPKKNIQSLPYMVRLNKPQVLCLETNYWPQAQINTISKFLDLIMKVLIWEFPQFNLARISHQLMILNKKILEIQAQMNRKTLVLYQSREAAISTSSKSKMRRLTILTN